MTELPSELTQGTSSENVLNSSEVAHSAALLAVCAVWDRSVHDLFARAAVPRESAKAASHTRRDVALSKKDLKAAVLAVLLSSEMETLTH